MLRPGNLFASEKIADANDGACCPPFDTHAPAGRATQGEQVLLMELQRTPHPE
jgi:hypothetical protein